MPKKKERNSDEWYKSQIRELEKENKHLRKRIRELEKREHYYDGSQETEMPYDTEDTHPISITTHKYCPSCGKGKLRELDIIGRIYEECDICDYRKKLRGPNGPT